MMYKYRSDIDPIQVRLKEDQVFKFELDCSMWAEDNSNITGTPVATVKTGDVTVGTPTTASNVVTMSFTQTNEGVSRVELSFTDGTYTGIQNIFIKYIDRHVSVQDDYGML